MAGGISINVTGSYYYQQTEKMIQVATALKDRRVNYCIVIYSTLCMVAQRAQGNSKAKTLFTKRNCQTVSRVRNYIMLISDLLKPRVLEHH